MFLTLLFLENLSNDSLGSEEPVCLSKFCYPRREYTPYTKIRISQISDILLLFATGIFASTNESSGPANTRKEILH